MRWRCSGLLVASMLAVAACGGDDGEPIDPEADEEIVNAAVLTIDDLPEGFVEEPPDDDDDDESADRCLEDILGMTRDEFEDSRTARSEAVQFEGDTSSIRVRVSAFADADVPGDVMDAFDGDDFIDCLREAFEDDPETAEFELTTLEARDPLAGDEATAYHLAVGLNVVEQDIQVESRLAALLVDRFVVSIESTSFEGGTDEAFLADALETMAERVESER